MHFTVMLTVMQCHTGFRGSGGLLVGGEKGGKVETSARQDLMPS